MRITSATLVRLITALTLLGLTQWAPTAPARAAGAEPEPVAVHPLAAGPLAGCEPDGTQASGAIYRLCMPTPLGRWNGELIVYAHGYVSPTDPPGIPESQLYLPDGTYIPTIANLLGYAFAVTGYSANGLAVREGLADLVDLVNVFKATHSAPSRVLLAGPSEGGLITTLAIEQYPEVFDGGLALCGPVGDFRAQANYLGDFRVAFDYFFPGLMPASPISIPTTLMDTWDTHYTANILPVITDPASAISVTQLLSVTQAAYDPISYTTSVSETIYGVLWYNVFATNDAAVKLGGQPFDNQTRVYTDSLDDAQLNAQVERFSADPAALAEIQAHYQTTGRPAMPLVTQHTLLDPIVPYWHETLYRDKVVANGWTPRHDSLTSPSYGHCYFTEAEVIQALTLLESRVSNPPPFYLLFVPFIGR